MPHAGGTVMRAAAANPGCAGAPLGQPQAEGARGEQHLPEAGQTGAPGGQEVLMPPQRRNWKRCASHVYIAHFIEYQIHKER